MNRKRITIVAAMACQGALAASTRAESSEQPSPVPPQSTEVIVVTATPRSEAQTRALGETAFLTITESADRKGQLLSAAAALASAPSTNLRALGGLGSFASVSVRGASPGHTLVMINGVPLSRIASVTADLGAFSLESFSQLELYRGALPIGWSGAGVGGAVNLITKLGRAKNGERVRLALGAGSFGARTVHGWYGDTIGKLGMSHSVAYLAATGNYPVFSNNGTPLITADDAFVDRSNNGFSSLELTSRVGDRRGAWSAGVRGLMKMQELPGSIYNPAAEATLATNNAIGDVTWRASRTPSKQLDLENRAFVAVEQQRYRDPANEIGLGSEQRKYRTLAVGELSQAEVAVGRTRLAAVGQIGAEHFADQPIASAMVEKPTTSGNRISAAVGIGAETTLGRLIVEPGIRFDWLRTAPARDDNAGELTNGTVRRDGLASPRLSSRYYLSATTAIKASIGRYARTPTLTELFGDRGFIVGSPGLLAERGTSVDLGIVAAPATLLRGKIDRLVAEATGFFARSSDTIVYIVQAGFAARPVNIGDAELSGGELAVSARVLKRFELVSNYSVLWATQRNTEPSFEGKDLPQRPRHRWYWRASWSGRIAKQRLGAFVDASIQSQSYLDEGNLQIVPARTLVGAGATIPLGRGFEAIIELKNMFDRKTEQIPTAIGMSTSAIVDVGGFPLPGRAIYARLQWSR